MTARFMESMQTEETQLDRLIEQLHQHLVLGAADDATALSGLEAVGEWVRCQQREIAASSVSAGVREEKADDLSPVDSWRGRCPCGWTTEHRLTRGEAEQELCWHSRDCRPSSPGAAMDLSWIVSDPETGHFHLVETAEALGQIIADGSEGWVWAADSIHDMITPCAVEVDGGVAHLIGVAGRQLTSIQLPAPHAHQLSEAS